MWFIQILVLAVLTSHLYGQAGLPIRFPTVTLPSSEPCASPLAEANFLKSVKENLSDVIRRYYQANSGSTCECSDKESSLTRVAYLNMADSSQSCPSAWAAINSTVRGCGRQPSSVASCDSVNYSTNGLSYTHVCGRINGYQYASPNGFHKDFGLESWYVDGVSLTHGPPGSREHVWTFVNEHFESDNEADCPCISGSSEQSNTVPSFVGNNYFCATGSLSKTESVLASDNPLWDGVGCTGSNTCCQFNQPPLFCRTLPTATSDDLEVRICGDQESADENIYISNLELYVK